MYVAEKRYIQAKHAVYEHLPMTSFMQTPTSSWYSTKVFEDKSPLFCELSHTKHKLWRSPETAAIVSLTLDSKALLSKVVQERL